jgi:hypothetical protein
MRENLQVLAADWRFIKATHQQVVQTFNPEERAIAELQSKMEALQAELHEAHSKVHASEQALNSTLTEVRRLEGAMASMQASAISDAIGPTAAAASAVATTSTTSTTPTTTTAPHVAASAAAAALPAAADVAQSSQRTRNTRLQSSLNVRLLPYRVYSSPPNSQ